jgi:dipeptidyl aminopeptidase/acylaminoacyl peptidase
MTIRKTAVVFLAVLTCALAALGQSKPKITLDEFFNAVSFPSIELSPDGAFVVVAAERADWDQQIFRSDLWLYRADEANATPIQLTQSGHDSEPKWSPDG